MRILITESQLNSTIFYHGTPDIKKWGLDNKGIHVGTKLAATQALQARIGVPAEGEWDGTRIYGKTLLAGKKTLKNKKIELGYYCDTGYNCGRDVPEEDYYPTQRQERAKYSDSSYVDFNSKPSIFPVQIIGKMKNTINKPIKDASANRKIIKDMNSDNNNHGYYYVNEAEDDGSISAVVPNKTFLKVL